MSDLAQRIQRLEDIDAIRQLKARYFHACDTKDLATLRDCFVAGELLIDYGAIGTFHQREDFLAVYQAMACHPHIIDMHHGHNAQINWIDSSNAEAVFDLFFHQINTQTGVVTQLGGFYNDRFVREDGVWKICATRFQITSSLTPGR